MRAEYRIQETEFRIQNTGDRIQNTEYEGARGRRGEGEKGRKGEMTTRNRVSWF